MRVAICGNPSFALKVQNSLRDIEVKFFIRDFVTMRGEDNPSINLPLITFFEFRRLVNAGELDGVIIAEYINTNFTKAVVKTFKLYGITQIGVINFGLPNPVSPIYWLDACKIFLPYLESDITDICNLKCRGCCHFANFSVDDDIYPLENFRRDLSKVAQTCEISTYHLLGGEPFMLKNLDEYMRYSRMYFPKSNLGIQTNGILIPSLPEKIFDSLRENNFLVSISVYPPTLKSIDKIKSALQKNGVSYCLDRFVDNFSAQITLNDQNDPVKSVEACRCSGSRSLLNGKIYKCPIDAFSFKLSKKFGIKYFSSPTGIDIHTSNFSSLLESLDDDVELCHWCAKKHRTIRWEPTNNPQIEDWLADPDELKQFV